MELSDKLLAATTSAISPVRGVVVLQATQSGWCFKQRDLASARVQQDRCDLGLGAVVQSGVASGAQSSCCFSLSSIFLGWKSFEGKIQLEIHFQLVGVIL